MAGFILEMYKPFVKIWASFLMYSLFMCLSIKMGAQLYLFYCILNDNDGFTIAT